MPCSTTSSSENLFERVEPAGRDLRAALETLRRFSVVGDVRGIGLLLAIEFVRDAKTREPFPPDARMAARIQEDALEAGVMTYPMQGCADGTRGDHILIAPPFTIIARDDPDARSRTRTRHRRSGEERILPAWEDPLRSSDRFFRWHHALCFRIFSLLCMAALAAPSDLATIVGIFSRGAAQENRQRNSASAHLVSADQISKFHRYLDRRAASGRLAAQ